MEPSPESSVWISRCQQLFDSALPNGGYAHSQGLEGLVQCRDIFDEFTFSEFVKNEFADSLIYTVLPVFRFAYAAVVENRYSDLVALDDLSRALKGTKELRVANSSIGRQTCRLYRDILDAGTSQAREFTRCLEFFTAYQADVVLAAVAACLRIPLAAALQAYCQQLISSLTTAVIKLLQFGPTQTQRLLHQLGELIPAWVLDADAVTLDNVGMNAPRWDIASARHEFAERRLFIS